MCLLKTGKTALFYAAHYGELAMCKELIEKGGDVNAADGQSMYVIPSSRDVIMEHSDVLLMWPSIQVHTYNKKLFRKELMWMMLMVKACML